ncbi:MAG: glycosyltransferase family 2 protein [Patescibacteria group bacterium]
MNQKKVWFVIVTYRPEQEALRRLITAIHEWPTEVVDNTDKNLGYGGGANKGMKKAFDAGARWVVVVNQDVTLTKVGIAKFVRALEECGPGVVGPEAGSLDPKRWTTILASRPALEAGRLDSRLRGNDNLSYISGSLMAIHRDVYKATGGFYGPYFMYYEDADLSVRAKKAGFELRQVIIDGFGHETHGRAGKKYYLARNHLLFVFRNAPVSVKFHEILRLPKTLWESLWS